jgi:exopolysaccharide production protein ExoQ
MRFHNGHILGAAAFLAVPLSIFAPLALSPILGLTSLAALFVLWRSKALCALAPSLPALILILFILLALASAGWSTDIAVTLDKVPRLALICAAGWIVIAAAGTLDGSARRVFGRMLVAGVVITLFALLFERATAGALLRLSGQKFVDFNLVFVAYNRGVTFFVLAVWGAGLVLCRRRWAAAGLIVAALAACLLHTSGGAVAGLLIGSIAFVAARVMPRQAPVLIAVVATAYIAAAPFLHMSLFSPHALHFDGPRSAEEDRQSRFFSRSAYHRLLIWNFAAKRALERPVLGWGFRTSRAVPGGKAYLDSSEQALPLHPHNGIIQIWLELGAAGAILAAVFAIGLMRAVRRWPIGDAGTEAACALFAAGFTIICVSYGLWQSWWLASLFFGAAFLIAARGPANPGAEPG